mgnify:CR=1 FL=1
MKNLRKKDWFGFGFLSGMVAIVAFVFLVSFGASATDDYEIPTPIECDQDECPMPTPECFENECETTPTATPSATPTQAPPPCNECGGDGLSDGRSDGRSSSPQVLGDSIPKGAPMTGRADVGWK